MVWISLLARLLACFLACFLSLLLFVFVCLLEFLLLLISATWYIDHRLALNSQKSAYLCLLNARIKGVCHHGWLHLDFCASSSLGDCLPDSGPIYVCITTWGSLFADPPSLSPVHSWQTDLLSVTPGLTEMCVNDNKFEFIDENVCVADDR